jgi:drug/metabolite transporter (DMT)-like permease
LFGVFWAIIIFDEQHSIWIWFSLAVMILALVFVTPKKGKNANDHA